MGIPLWIICCFSFAAFNICSLCLIFINLINMCLGVFQLGIILFGTLGFLDLGSYFLSHFREVFNYYLLKYLLMAFLFVLLFCNSYDSNVGAFNIVSEISEIVLISFHSFFLSASFTSNLLSSTSLILSSASVTVGSFQSDFNLCYCIIHY